MRLPIWVHVTVWSAFGALALLPPTLLAIDALTAVRSGAAAVNLLHDDPWRLLGRSAAIAAGAAGLSIALGAPFALLCERTDLPGRRWWQWAGLIPLLIPPFVHALVWSRLLAPNGEINHWLAETWGLVAPDIHSPVGVAFVLALSYFPFVTVLCTAGLRGVDRRMEEAGLLRVGPNRVLFSVTLPLVRPHLVTGALFVFMFSLVQFATADALRVQTYPLEIFIQFSALYDEEAAVSLSLPLLAVALTVVALLTWTMRGRSYVNLGVGHDSPRRLHLGPWRSSALGFCCALIGLSVAVPLVDLLITAGPVDTYLNALRSSGGEIAVSVGLALVGALAATLLGAALALSLRELRGLVQRALDWVAQIPFAIAPVLLGVGLIAVWNRPQTDWLYGGVGIVIIGYVAHFIPFAFRTVDAALSQIDSDQISAAQLAAGPIAVFGGVLVPLLRNGLLSACFIVFVLALGELGVTLLITPPGISPIPIGIYNLMHYGADDAVAALCLILIAIQLSVGTLLYLARRRNEPRT